jgi:hypothetical protein
MFLNNTGSGAANGNQYNQGEMQREISNLSLI